MTDKEIRNFLIEKGGVEKLQHKKDGSWVAKQFFFYRHGFNAEKLAVGIINSLRTMGVAVRILSAEEHWNAWPRDSWWEVRFKVL